jgi:hypothetical protein
MVLAAFDILYLWHGKTLCYKQKEQTENDYNYTFHIAFIGLNDLSDSAVLDVSTT